MLSGVSTDQFARLVHAGDVVALTKIPGIGKKTAERIVVELRDRLDGMAGMPRHAAAKRRRATGCSRRGDRGAAAARLQAGRGIRLVQKVAADGDSAEAIIRKALRAALGS